jgi:hypothetical protein
MAMAAFLLSTLFLASGLLALATIVDSWRRHAPAVRGLRAELAACDEWRQVRVRIVELGMEPVRIALRPRVTAAGRPVQHRVRRAALRAAA